MPRAKQRDDLLGAKFGLLTVVAFSKVDELRRAIWECQCACGSVVNLATSVLKSKHNISCGCALRERLSVGKLRHGLTGTKVWQAWVNMRSRCYKKSAARYANYGGRGIKVCDRWLVFENFYSDMGDVPQGMSIERINVDGDYCPENCKWATSKEQGGNKTSTLMINLFDNAYPFATLVKLSGLKTATAYARLKQYGWTPEKTFSNIKPESLHAHGKHQDT